MDQQFQPRSDPPLLKAARIGQHTIITVVSIIAVVTLAIQQHWTQETSLMAIGALSGLWSLGNVIDRKRTSG